MGKHHRKTPDGAPGGDVDDLIFHGQPPSGPSQR